MCVCNTLFSSVQFSSVAQSCPTLCDPVDCSMPGLPVHHHLLEFTQTHVHRVSDAIQPSHPLSSPSPPALNLSQHQSLFKWVSSSHQVAKALELQLQHQSFQMNAQDWVPLRWTGWISFVRNAFIYVLMWYVVSQLFVKGMMTNFSIHYSRVECLLLPPTILPNILMKILCLQLIFLDYISR